MHATAERKKTPKPRQKQQPNYYVAPSYSLASPAGKKAVEELKQKLIANPELAKKFYQNAGILTADGKLSERYGG
jgi:phosphoribosylaminoimidazole-succinocarboxamide synthase